MRRLHVIEDFDRIGGEIYYKHEEKERMLRDPELREAYMCGRKEAYKEIMEDQYGERNYGGGGYNHREGGMGYREEDYDGYGERRGVRGTGRYSRYR